MSEGGSLRGLVFTGLAALAVGGCESVSPRNANVVEYDSICKQTRPVDQCSGYEQASAASEHLSRGEARSYTDRRLTETGNEYSVETTSEGDTRRVLRTQYGDGTVVETYAIKTKDGRVRIGQDVLNGRIGK